MKRQTVKIDTGIFEHILNCLATQKFLHEQSPNIQKEWQAVIDTAWKVGMDKITASRTKIGSDVE